MSTDLQALVDALGARLNRAISVDDARFRLVAYNEHPGELDEVRLAKLLQRQASAPVQAWLEEHGARTAEHYTCVPANPGLRMAARILLPLRFDGLLLGWIAMINEPAPLDDDEIAEALRYSRDISVAMFRLHRLPHDDRRPEVALVRQLLEMPSDRGGDADADLSARGFLAITPLYCCIVTRARGSGGEPLPDSARVRIAAAVDGMRGIVEAHHFMTLAIGEEVIGVLAIHRESEGDAFAASLVKRMQARFGTDEDIRFVVGVGGTVGRVADLRRSLDQAECAARIAQRVDGIGPLACWSALGSYRTVARLLADSPRQAELLPSAVRRLLDHPDAGTLVQTLETYLDHGGDVKATAGALFVHRSTLYPRLRRIEEITGAELSSGEVRLELHLGLRLWRLAPPVAA